MTKKEILERTVDVTKKEILERTVKENLTVSDGHYIHLTSGGAAICEACSDRKEADFKQYNLRVKLWQELIKIRLLESDKGK